MKQKKNRPNFSPKLCAHNYADVAKQNEPELGLPNTVILTKGGKFSPKSREVMDKNLTALRKPETDRLLQQAYETALKDAKPAWREVAHLILKKADWAVAQKIDFLRSMRPGVMSAREIASMRRHFAAIA